MPPAVPLARVPTADRSNSTYHDSARPPAAVCVRARERECGRARACVCARWRELDHTRRASSACSTGRLHCTQHGAGGYRRVRLPAVAQKRAHIAPTASLVGSSCTACLQCCKLLCGLHDVCCRRCAQQCCALTAVSCIPSNCVARCFAHARLARRGYNWPFGISH